MLIAILIIPAICIILKSLMKLAALTVILVLRIAMLLTKIVGYVGSYIMSPVIIFILGCGIYCLVKTRRTDVAIHFGMEAVIGLLMFGGLWIYCNTMDLCDSMAAYLHK